jgi:transposase
MAKPSKQQQARQRAKLILKVRAGEITATQAAEQLGISRKTYYKWEKRGLAAMLEGLSEREPGRPSAEPEPESEVLKRKVAELEKELRLRKRSETLREALKDLEKKD